jgi:hypothetical protein
MDRDLAARIDRLESRDEILSRGMDDAVQRGMDALDN